jgi:outer membrane protein OmpA-like peptidoglycan-associated protein
MANSAELESKESAPVLNEVAQFTNRCPSVVIQISGHTDTDGSKELNQQLSEERARAVADALSQRGVKAGRLKTTGYGFSRPVADNATEEGKQQNRRIEFSQISASSEVK